MNKNNYTAEGWASLRLPNGAAKSVDIRLIFSEADWRKVFDGEERMLLTFDVDGLDFDL